MSQDQLLVSTRKGLFTVRREAGEWRIADVQFLGDNVTLTLADRRDGTRYAAINHGHFGVKMHRCDADGKWIEIPAPAYPSQPEGEVELDMWGKPIPWKLQLVWSLEAGRPDQPGRIWCGTLPGGLFVSNDRGDSWQLVETLWRHPDRKRWMGGGADLPGIHSICVDPRDGRKVAVGVSCGGVWYTADDGGTWENRAHGMFADYAPPESRFDLNIQDPHRVVQCVGQPERFWAQHHNGVFRCVDGLQSWHAVPNVSPSVFGFAVAVHPENADVAWFIPATKDERRIPVEGRVVVARTRDGGQTFDVLRQGLPQQHAYDLVFRHALDVDAAGQRLAFGSTTGSLWVSDDQGDSWQTVSQHLPPIYSVRFV